MNRLQRCAALFFPLAVVACGAGISEDPTALDRPVKDAADRRVMDAADAEERDDGDRRDTLDTARPWDVAFDGPARSDGGPVDSRPESSGGDIDGGDEDGGMEGGSDVAVDVSRDTSPPSSDASNDALADLSVDGARDASIDLVAGDVSNDAMSDVARDAPPIDSPDRCTVGCDVPQADYYVDANAPAGGDGTLSKPFKTITDAIQAHMIAPDRAKLAYVAPGTYDEAAGERFPLVLHGLSIQGAGQDRTFIVGSGLVPDTETGGWGYRSMGTIVAGHSSLPTRIAHLSLHTVSPVPAEFYHGILCNQGNAASEATAPDGVTRVDSVTVGPGYARGLLVTSSPAPSVAGCSLTITASTVTGNWFGVWADGCDSTAPAAVPVVLNVGGSDPESGNTFSLMYDRSMQACGVYAPKCVKRGLVQYNTFVDSICGAALEAGPGLTYPTGERVHFSVKHNTFERLSSVGLRTLGPAILLDEVSDNRFVNITRPLDQSSGELASGLSLDLNTIGTIRRNQFIGNDRGVRVFYATEPGGAADFGTPDDPGNNVFRCNSALIASGSDFLVEGSVNDPPTTNWDGTIHLAGNAWDHVPPTVRRVDPFPNGSDVATIDGLLVGFDLTNPTPATPDCPIDRVPGQ